MSRSPRTHLDYSPLHTNHIHLLLTPKKAESILWLVISLGRRYIYFIKTTYRQVRQGGGIG